MGNRNIPERSDTPGPQALPSLPPLFLPGTPPAPAAASPAPRADGAGDFAATSNGAFRRARGLSTFLVLLVVILGAVAGGTVLLANKGPTSPAIQSPSQANAQLYAAAMAAGSFHYTDVSSGSIGGNAVNGTESGDVGRNEGTQSMTSTVGNYEVVVINSVAYMKSDSVALENSFGYSASEAAPYANRWIEFTASDAPYSSVAADLTTGSTWGDPSKSPGNGLSHSARSVTAVSTLNGRSVQSIGYSIHGSSKTAGSSYTGREQISFAATAPHLPYYLTGHLSGTVNQQPSTEDDKVTFGRWGEAVHVAAPAGAIPYSSLPPPQTTA
ncbi:MAG: hypothetical protein ACRDYE_07270 [Acidimicrobiales bacterium]